MFLVLAVLELESKAQKRLALGERGFCLEALSTLILVSLSPILCQALALAIGGSAILWLCILVPVLIGGVSGTSARHCVARGPKDHGA